MLTAASSRIRVATLDDLRAKRVIVVHGDRPIAVVADGDRVFAVDNRCPHLGFPLHKGTVKDGILTCHWHEARFDLSSGCTFDLFADDVPTYETSIDDGVVYVAAIPRQKRDAAFHAKRLQSGLEHDIGLTQAKSIIGLRKTGSMLANIVRDVALFGCRHHDAWGEGMTILSVVGSLSPCLSEETAYFALCRATSQVATDCDGAVASRRREPLDYGEHAMETLRRWFRQWVEARHRDGAERVLMTAIESVESESDLSEMIFTALTDRIYPGTGHPYDFANRVFELLDFIGWEHAERMFPLVLQMMCDSRGAEEDAHWHYPVEIVEPLRQAEKRIESLMSKAGGAKWNDDGALVETLLGDDPLKIIDALSSALSAGAPPAELAKWVAYAAALRLAQFAVANEVGDWFNPRHTFIYANAVHRAIGRNASPTVARGIFHAALSVYMDRFLNVPPARLPTDGKLADLASDSSVLRQQLLEVLDQRAEVDAAANIVARFMRQGHPVEELIDTLTYATVREDLDFHAIEVLEAGARQVREWQGRPEAEHILVGVVRQLAAFCPTPRAGLQTSTVAMRLERGDKIYDE